MISETMIKRVMQKYIDGFNEGDAAAVASLFANHATIEDPVGGGKLVEGREAIDAMYKHAVSAVEKLELAAPIRGSHGNSGAMPFIIHLSQEGKPVQIHCIDVMTFNDTGEIIDMKAYWGKEDMIEG